MSDLFPPSEYHRRHSAIQARLQAAGLDAILLTQAADIFYVTGFLTRFWESPARPWFLVIPATGAPIAVIPEIGAHLMGKSVITDIRTWSAPRPEDDGISLLAETLSEVVPQGGKIGVAMGHETHLRMPLGDYSRLEGRLAPRAFVDATDVMHRTREVKSPLELEKLRQICAIADRAFARVGEIARAGTNLDVAFRAFQILLLEEGADWVSYVAGGAGQGGYGDVISPAAPKQLCNGDILMLDTGAVKDGYFCDFDRNFAIGTPSPEAARGHQILHDTIYAAMEVIAPNMRACDLHSVLCREITARGGAPCAGRLGHGLGVTLTEWPSLTPQDQTVLPAGMVLTLEPSVDLGQGRILVAEENIVITENGAGFLTNPAPRDIPIL
ncbi:Xaa-Pro peptidase family protein [Rhodobacteraceae bacterium XHP0102]|nr:Xaa-Pro peptidase family protein [Rhodobacteraceae bacterium XHP0102]